MISHHLSDEYLVEYAAGSLPEAEALVRVGVKVRVRIRVRVTGTP